MKNMILIGLTISGLFGLSGSVLHESDLLPPEAHEIQGPHLKTVNGLSLYDDRQAVIEKLGEPQSITSDDLLTDLDIYEYPSMNVVFQDDIIYFIEILAEAETLRIDDAIYPATIDALRAAFGEPDSIAEDGIVFQRNDFLLKLFIDSETQELISISFFHIAVV